MTDPQAISQNQKTPSIVIFVAILNFLTAAFFALLNVICILGMFFGTSIGAVEQISEQMSQAAAQANVSLGITVLFAVGFVFSLIFFLGFLYIGIGLLKGHKLAWYLQIASSVIGLFGFPLGTILNSVILVLLFQPPIRHFFKV